MKTNKNLFFVHNIFAITTKKNLFLFVFTGFFLFFLRPPKAYILYRTHVNHRISNKGGHSECPSGPLAVFSLFLRDTDVRSRSASATFLASRNATSIPRLFEKDTQSFSLSVILLP